MKIAIAGSRKRYWKSEEDLKTACELLLSHIRKKYESPVIVVGDEPTGVDAMIAKLCQSWKIAYEIVPADGRDPKDLVKRTKKVVKSADIVYVLFPYEMFCSRGTTAAAVFACRMGKPCYICVYADEKLRIKKVLGFIELGRGTYGFALPEENRLVLVSLKIKKRAIRTEKLLLEEALLGIS